MVPPLRKDAHTNIIFITWLLWKMLLTYVMCQNSIFEDVHLTIAALAMLVWAIRIINFSFHGTVIHLYWPKLGIDNIGGRQIQIYSCMDIWLNLNLPPIFIWHLSLQQLSDKTRSLKSGISSTYKLNTYLAFNSPNFCKRQTLKTFQWNKPSQLKVINNFCSRTGDAVCIYLLGQQCCKPNSDQLWQELFKEQNIS